MMKILVCIKQVPDTTEIRIDPVTKTLIREGVPAIMNPDDKGGLEFALQLKDKFGAEVTVVTMGIPAAAHHRVPDRYRGYLHRRHVVTDRGRCCAGYNETD